MNIKRLVAFGSIALVGLLTMVGAAVADNYASGLESPDFSTTWTGPGGTSENPGTVNGQDGWHSATKTDIPALPNGYDQAVVDNSLYQNYVDNGGGLFGAQSLRVSNAYTEPSGEFFYQTYSKSTTENAGEGLDNTVYTGEFQFIPTTDQFQPNLYVRVSPDNGTGGRMSFVGLRDVQNGVDDGIQMTFFDTDASGAFVPHELGVYPRDEVHTIKFDIKFVDGPANDIVRLYVDGTDMGEELDECFTTWEQFYREVSHESVPVTNSIEFRVQGNGTTIANLVGGGYLFDNVSNTTGTSGGPAPTTCGLAEDGKILPTGTTCQQYANPNQTPPALARILYTTKGTGGNATINSVSPGVFFYYTKVTGDEGQSVGITQTDNGSTPAIPIQQGQVLLYDADTCTKLRWTPTITGGEATGTLPDDGDNVLSEEGDFIIGVKYNPAALQKKAAPSPSTVTYSFGTTLDDDPFQAESTIDLAPKK